MRTGISFTVSAEDRTRLDLQAAINRFIAEHNDTEAKPFIWRADPDEIIAARNRGFQMLDSIH
jgi:hypothetical protein